MLVVDIGIEKIVEDPENRKTQEASIIQSVKEIGVLHPIHVRRLANPDGQVEFMVVSGNRRLASARHFGLETIPCVEVGGPYAVLQGVENFDRLGLSPMDESDQIIRMKREGMDPQEICGMLNISMWQLRRREKLQDLCKNAKKALIEGKISHTAAMELSLVSKSIQTEILDKWQDTGNIIHQVKSRALVDLSGKAHEIKSFDLEGRTCDTCPLKSEEQSLFEEDGICPHADCFERRFLACAKAIGIPIFSNWWSDDERKRFAGFKLIESWCRTEDPEDPEQFTRAFSTKGEVCWARNEDRRPTAETDKQKSTLVRQQRKAFHDSMAAFIKTLIPLASELRYRLESKCNLVAGVFGDKEILGKMLRQALSTYTIESYASEILALYYPEYGSKQALKDASNTWCKGDKFDTGTYFTLCYLQSADLLGVTGFNSPGTPTLATEIFHRWIDCAHTAVGMDCAEAIEAYSRMLEHQKDLGNEIQAPWLSEYLKKE